MGNWEPQENEMYVPVDMHATEEDLDDFDEALEKLGPQVTAKCLVQAFDRFNKKKHLLPADKQKDLTAKEYQEQHPDQDGDEEEEEEKGDVNEAFALHVREGTTAQFTNLNRCNACITIA